MHQVFIDQLNIKLQKNSNSELYLTWKQEVNGWSNDKIINLFNALNKLKNHQSYFGKDPKIIGMYDNEPFKEQPLIVFGEVGNVLDKNGIKKFKNKTNNLRIKLDGTAYAIRDNYNADWKQFNI